MKPKYILLALLILFLLLKRLRGAGGFSLIPRGGNEAKPTNNAELNRELDKIQSQGGGSGSELVPIYAPGANLNIPAGTMVNTLLVEERPGEKKKETARTYRLEFDLIEPIENFLTSPGANASIAELRENSTLILDVFPGSASESFVKTKLFVGVPNEKINSWVVWK